MIRPVLGGPGVSDERRWTHKYVFRDGRCDYLPGGGLFNATKCRDPFAAELSGNTSDVLQPGLFMGQESTTQKWAPSFFGKLSAAVAHGGTTVTVGATHAVEVVRRIGSTGSLLIVGPPVANGLAQVGKLTYSAVDQTTGAITVTATGQNEVQTLNIAGTVSGGTFRIGFPQADGTYIWTGTIAHNATFSTVISNANTALDAIFGSGVVVAAGSAYTGITLTFTTTTQAVRNAGPVAVAIAALTGATSVTVTETTPGYFGGFAAGSLIGGTDGTFYPKSFIEPGYGRMCADGSNQPTVEQWPRIPITGMPEWSELAPTITDTGIRLWIAQQMSDTKPAGGGRGGKFIFPDFYNVA